MECPPESVRSWLAGALAEERATLGLQLERNHSALLARLDARLAAAPSALPPRKNNAVPAGLPAAAEAIAQSLPAGLRVCILGGQQFQDPDTEALVAATGRAFAARLSGTAVVLTGGMPGVQRTFAEALGPDFPALVNLLPEGQASNFGVGRDVPCGACLDERMQIFGQLGQVYITFEGGPGVAKEARAAYERGALVLPVPSTGGASGGKFDFPAGALQRPPCVPEALWACLLVKGPPSVTADAIVAIIISHLERIAPVTSSAESPTASSTPAAVLCEPNASDEAAPYLRITWSGVAVAAATAAATAAHTTATKGQAAATAAATAAAAAAHSEHLKAMEDHVLCRFPGLRYEPGSMLSHAHSKVLLGDEAVLSWNFKAVIEHPSFEAGFAVLIVFNAVVMALEMQYAGFEVGHRLGYPAVSPGVDTWPGAKGIFDVLSAAFGCLFTMELFFKLGGLKRNFFLSGWNWFDLIVIFVWAVDSFFSSSGLMDFFPVSPMTLRLTRLARVLRMVRLVRAANGLDSLHLLIHSMRASIPIMLWSTQMLALIVSLTAMCLNGILQSSMADPNGNAPTEEEREVQKQVYKYFGTYSRAMLTVFEVTVGNWVPVCRMLVEDVSEWYSVCFLAYKCVVGFAVVKVISSVFISDTFKVLQTDDEILIMQQEKNKRKLAKKMRELFHECDRTGTGLVSWEDFRDVVNDHRIQTWLSAMDLDVHDARLVFDLLDTGDHMISADDLVRGFSRLKGSAKSLDLAALRREIHAIFDKVRKLEERPVPEKVAAAAGAARCPVDGLSAGVIQQELRGLQLAVSEMRLTLARMPVQELAASRAQTDGAIQAEKDDDAEVSRSNDDFRLSL